MRRTVLRPALPADAPLPGDDETGVVHIGAFADGALLSACLVFAAPCPWLAGKRSWRLRSMATYPHARGRGAGAVVLAEAARIAGANGAEVLWCLARETAVGFYRRHGWAATGELFVAAGLPHLRMWLELAAAGSQPA